MKTGYPQYPIAKRVHGNKMCRNLSPKKLWVNQDVVMIDCRPKATKLYPTSLIRKLEKANVYSSRLSRRLYEKTLYRIFLNPSADVIEYITKFKETNYENRQVLGVQIRMGGCLANTKEETEMMSFSRLLELPGTIYSALQSLRNPVIYLSTDSDFAENYLRRRLSDIPIFTSSMYFNRSHTCGQATISSVKSSLVDLFLLADSDIMIINKLSGFGMIAKQITRATRVIQFDVVHTIRPECLKKK